MVNYYIAWYYRICGSAQLTMFSLVQILVDALEFRLSTIANDRSNEEEEKDCDKNLKKAAIDRTIENTSLQQSTKKTFT